MNRYGTFTIVVACAALALSGCTGSARDLYHEEQAAADVLPTGIAVDDGWDTSTSRLLASYEGYQFYIFTSTTTTAGDCLMIYDFRYPGDWVVGCATEGPLVITGPTGVRATFDWQGLPEETPVGWTRLTPELEVTGT